ncbi:MAG TPA: hypothetical protein VH913_14320 [Hyphomicrobiaceae bacterium]|jgi:hypothetical protein
MAVAAAALGLSRWIFALAIMGAGVLSLTVVSRVRGAAAPIPTIKVIVQPSTESTRAAPTPSGPAFSDATFRFGFLEFEDDAHASSG